MTRRHLGYGTVSMDLGEATGVGERGQIEPVADILLPANVALCAIDMRCSSFSEKVRATFMTAGDAAVNSMPGTYCVVLQMTGRTKYEPPFRLIPYWNRLRRSGYGLIAFLGVQRGNK